MTIHHQRVQPIERYFSYNSVVYLYFLMKILRNLHDYISHAPSIHHLSTKKHVDVIEVQSDMLPHSKNIPTWGYFHGGKYGKYRPI